MNPSEALGAKSVETEQFAPGRHRRSDSPDESSAPADSVYRLHFERSPLPSFVFNVETLQFVAVNAAALRLYGYAREEFLALSLLDIRPPEDRALAAKIVTHLPKAGRIADARRSIEATGQHRNQDRSGRIFFVDASFAEVDGGHQRLCFVTVEDLTDRLAKEASARQETEHFSMALNAGTIGRWELDLATKRLQCSEQCKANFGRRTAQPFSYDELIESIHPDDRGQMITSVGRAIAEAGDYRAEYRIIWPDGTLHWIDARGRALSGPDGCVARMMGVTLDITARKRAELLVRESDEFSRSLMDSSSDCVKVLDLNGCISSMNVPGLCLMELDDFASVSGQHWTTLWPAESRTAIERALQRASGGESDSFVGACPTAKGTMKWWDVRVSPVRDGTGRVVRVLAVSRDITEREQTSEALRLSRKRLDLLTDASEVGVWFCDLPFDELKWDHRVKEHFWLPPDAQVTVQMFYDIIHPDDRERTRQAVEAAVANDEHYDIDYRTVAPDGRVKWIRAIGHSTYDADGKPVHFDGVTIDITDHRIAEERLRESEERFRAMADNISQFAWMADATGSLFWYNQRWYDYTGTTLEEMKGSGWGKVHHPEHIERVRVKWEKHLVAGDAWSDTFPLRGKDGNYRWFLSTARPIRDAAGQISLWFGTNTDVTDLRDAEETARAASMAKDNFLAQLSHELRTPLTPVLLTAAEMREDATLPPTVRERFAMIERNIALEARLIDDLLDLTRITRGKLTLRCESYDAHSLIGLAVEIIRDEAREKQIGISFDLAARASQLHCDSARLQQVFWNLLRNAVKFTPSGGGIQIRSRNDEGSNAGAGTRLVIEVTDTGIGFEPDLREKLFEPFEQGTVANDQRFPGLGLGLAIARAIVDMHRGSIRAESAGSGRGATFVVELPVDASMPANPIPLENAAGEKSAVRETPQRLLLVEDHAPTLQVLSRLLARAGHRITTATSIESALAAAATDTFDLVISDLGLPDGSGIELMQVLREKHGLRGIALSGYGTDDDQRNSRAAGFIAHLTKPVDVAQIHSALREIARTSIR